MLQFSVPLKSATYKTNKAQKVYSSNTVMVSGINKKNHKDKNLRHKETVLMFWKTNLIFQQVTMQKIV